MTSRKFCEQILFATFVTLIACSGPARADNEQQANHLMQQAVAKFKDGKLSEAVDLEDQAIKQQPKEWLPHSVMSFFYWQQGNVIDAVAEAQKAVRYSPQNPVALINLGHIYQILENYRDAIPLYDEARKLAPENWDSYVGLAQCYVSNNQTTNGLEVLQDMAAKNSSSYDWWQHLGDTYLIIDKPALAVGPLEKAAQLASTADQKVESGLELFVALLRDNQYDKAGKMLDTVLGTYQPKSSEVYVRAAEALLPASEPASAKELLKVASKNLDQIRDSDAFFRLGKVFEDKADRTGGDSTKVNGWLDNAEYAYNQAIDLNPGVGANHLALAGVLDRKGKPAEAVKEISQAASYDGGDLLAPFLKSCLNGTGKTSETQVQGVSEVKPEPVRLTAIKFTVNGLTCNCQVAKVESTLLQVKGVVYSHIARLKPYEGTILIDQAVTPLDKAFAQVPEKAFGSADALGQPVTFPISSQTSISSVDTAVRLSQSSTYGDVLKFPRQFDLTGPSVPPLVAGRDGSSS